MNSLLYMYIVMNSMVMIEPAESEKNVAKQKAMNGAVPQLEPSGRQYDMQKSPALRAIDMQMYWYDVSITPE